MRLLNQFEQQCLARLFCSFNHHGLWSTRYSQVISSHANAERTHMLAVNWLLVFVLVVCAKVEVITENVRRCKATHPFCSVALVLSGPQNPSEISGAIVEEDSFFSQVSCHTKCLLFLPPINFSWGLLCLHHPSSLCKYTGILIENSQSVDSSLWSFCRAPMQYFPLHSQVINLPVIGETHWQLSIKWHLIYALFMPHLCAQVLQLFIKCPLLCQNMEIERRYSWYSQQTHQWTGSHRGPPLTVTIKSHPDDCVAGGADF